MKKADWKDIAELIGIASIVASLVFVGLEMRQARHLALADGQMTASTAVMAYQSLIASHPSIWNRGKAGESLNEEDAAIFESLVVASNDLAFSRVAFSSFLDNQPDREFAVHDFASFLFENPGAYRVWVSREMRLDKNRKFLSEKGNIYSFWVESVNRDLAKLEKIYGPLKGK